MINVKDYIEETMIRRLSDKKRDVCTVSDIEFSHLMEQMREMMANLARRVKVNGMSEEDIFSLYALKVHQVLRRGMYDRKKPPRVFFYVVFTYFNRDLHRLAKTALERGLDEDSFAYSFLVDTQTSEIYAPSLDRHLLDVAMERLSLRHQRIVNITLDRLEKNDTLLIPLAKDILSFWL